MDDAPQDRAPPPPAPAFRVAWLLALFVLLVTFLVLPTLVERVEYAITRGRVEAESDLARGALQDVTLTTISRQFSHVAKAIEPSVVHIDTQQVLTDSDEWAAHTGSREPRAEGQGSGVIIDKEGYILTNFHVVENSRQVHVRLNGSEVRRANIIGVDPGTDLAVIKIESGGLVAAEWGDSDALSPGSLVWAVGNPFGLDHSISFGIISAKNRRGLTGSPYQDFLQTDAAVNPGNSGGPLVDINGKVVGINTAIVGRAQGIGFSIPSALARQVYDELRATGKVAHGWLGVQLAPVTADDAASASQEPPGALIVKLVPGAPADKAGLKRGDIITRWQNQPVTSHSELPLLIGKTPIGSKAIVTVVRDDETLQVEVVVEERPTVISR